MRNKTAILSQHANTSGANPERLQRDIQNVLTRRDYGPASKAHTLSQDQGFKRGIERSVSHDFWTCLRSHKSVLDHPASLALQNQVRDKTIASADDQTWLMRLVKSHPWPNGSPSVRDQLENLRSEQLGSLRSTQTEPYQEFIDDLAAEKTAAISFGMTEGRANFQSHVERVNQRLAEWSATHGSSPWRRAEELQVPSTVSKGWSDTFEGFKSNPAVPPTSEEYNQMMINKDPRYESFLHDVDLKIASTALATTQADERAGSDEAGSD